jgi:hypothetical protein
MESRSFGTTRTAARSGRPDCSATAGDCTSSFSERFRNRLELDFERKVGELAIMPYANVEPFYDTRYDT